MANPRPPVKTTPILEIRDGMVIEWPPAPSPDCAPTGVISVRRVYGAPTFRSLHLDGFQYAIVLEEAATVTRTFT